MNVRHARRSVVLALIVFGLASSAFAQNVSRYDVSGGWQMLRGDDQSIHGWYGDIGVNLNRVVALVGNVDGLYETIEESAQAGSIAVNLRAETRVHTFLGGVRLNVRGVPGIVPYAEVLAGGLHLSGTATTTITGLPQSIEEVSEGYSVVQIGGGVTLDVTRRLGVRVGVAHRRVFFEDESGGNTRIAAGAVLRF